MTEFEIVPGLVLPQDPDVLLALGGKYRCSPQIRVRGDHSFRCHSVSGGSGTWLTLYSRPGSGRQLISKSGRTGHPGWTGGVYYWHRDQVWDTPHAAVIAATQAAGDLSRPGSRNMLAVKALPVLGF